MTEVTPLDALSLSSMRAASMSVLFREDTGLQGATGPSVGQRAHTAASLEWGSFPSYAAGPYCSGLAMVVGRGWTPSVLLHQPPSKAACQEMRRWTGESAPGLHGALYKVPDGLEVDGRPPTKS